MERVWNNEAQKWSLCWSNRKLSSYVQSVQHNGRVAHHRLLCFLPSEMKGNVWNENENKIKILKAPQTPWSMWRVNLDKEQYIRKPYWLCSTWKGARREFFLIPPDPPKPSPQTLRLFLHYFESRQSVMNPAQLVFERKETKFLSISELVLWVSICSIFIVGRNWRRKGERERRLLSIFSSI